MQYLPCPHWTNRVQFWQAKEEAPPHPIAFHHEQLEPWQGSIISFYIAIQHIYYQINHSIRYLNPHTLFTRSFNCFLPCSWRSPGVLGDDILITWHKMWYFNRRVKTYNIGHSLCNRCNWQSVLKRKRKKQIMNKLTVIVTVPNNQHIGIKCELLEHNLQQHLHWSYSYQG